MMLSGPNRTVPEDLLMGVDSSWVDMCFRIDEMWYPLSGEVEFEDPGWGGPYACCVWDPSPAGKFSRDRFSVGVNVCCTDFTLVEGPDERWGAKNERAWRRRFPIQLGLAPDWGRPCKGVVGDDGEATDEYDVYDPESGGDESTEGEGEHDPYYNRSCEPDWEGFCDDSD
jgi:hypothetical protein